MVYLVRAAEQENAHHRTVLDDEVGRWSVCLNTVLHPTPECVKGCLNLAASTRLTLNIPRGVL